MRIYLLAVFAVTAFMLVTMAEASVCFYDDGILFCPGKPLTIILD